MSKSMVTLNGVALRKPGMHHADWHPAKERASGQWAHHDVDMDKAVHGKRYAQRGVVSTWGAHFLIMRDWEPVSFMRGKGLRRSVTDHTLYVQGKVVGYHSDMQFCLGYIRAAHHVGLEAEFCHSEG